VQENRGESANYAYTNQLKRRLENSKLHPPFKLKGTSNILGALGAIQSDRNLTNPPLVKYEGHGRSWVNLPKYESLLQEYRLIYQEKYSEDYKKLYPEEEPSWGVTEKQIKKIKTGIILEKSETLEQISN